MNTYGLITALKARYSLTSDYQVAKFLELTPQSVSLWKNGKECSDNMAIKLSELLDYNAARILMEIQGHRTSCPITKKAFIAYAESLPLKKKRKNNKLKKVG